VLGKLGERDGAKQGGVESLKLSHCAVR